MGYDDKNSLDGPDYTCSFCGKKQSQVKKLIAGHNVFICDECIALCNEMLEKDLKAPAEENHHGSAQTQGNQGHPGRICHRPGRSQEDPGCGCIQPLQTDQL